MKTGAQLNIINNILNTNTQITNLRIGMINSNFSCNCNLNLKLFTRLLNTRLEHIVEENNMLCDLQYGFRKRKSTMDAIMVVTTAIEKSKLDDLDAGNGK